MTGSLRHSQGALIPFYKTLSNGSATIVLNPGKGGAIVNELQISNGTGSAVTVIVDVHDGTNVLYEPEPGVSVSTTAKLDTDGLPLADGHTLRVTGAANVYVWGTFYRGVYENRTNSPVPRPV